MTSSPKNNELLSSPFVDVDLPASRLAEWRATLLSRWARSPTAFLTAIDPTTRRLDGRPSYVWVTTDEREKLETEKPFPNWAYLSMMFGLFQRHNVCGIEKSRQVFATTATLAYAFWLCAFYSNQRVLLSKATQPEAETLLEDKIRAPFRRMPPWIQDALEITEKPAKSIRFRSSKMPPMRSTRSMILAVAQNAAVRSLRGGTASLVIIDEAALQDHLAAMLRAAAPMAARIICLTSADGGQAGGDAFVEYFECLPEKKKRLKPLTIPIDDTYESGHVPAPEATVSHGLEAGVAQDLEAM